MGVRGSRVFIWLRGLGVQGIGFLSLGLGGVQTLGACKEVGVLPLDVLERLVPHLLWLQEYFQAFHVQSAANVAFAITLGLEAANRFAFF